MKIVKENACFFTAFALWLILGAVWLLTCSAGEEIMFWSGRRSAFGDALFKTGNLLGEGPAWIAIGTAGLFFRYRHAILVALTGFTVLWVSFLSKTLFAHERPAAYLRRIDQFDQVNMVDGVDLHFGATSFPSGHTMSAFALFALVALLIPYKRTPALALFLVALLVGLARIYLVQHFMKDIYAGSVFGVALAMALYLLHLRYPMHTPAWYNRGLWSRIRPSA